MSYNDWYEASNLCCEDFYDGYSKFDARIAELKEDLASEVKQEYLKYIQDKEDSRIKEMEKPE